MPKYMIERELPGAGKMSAEELKAISEKSVGILKELGTGIQWVHSYVADDMVYCVYNATDIDIIKKHAECGGFPVNKVSQVQSIIDPTTAEA